MQPIQSTPRVQARLSAMPAPNAMRTMPKAMLSQANECSIEERSSMSLGCDPIPRIAIQIASKP
jgi:hypothetical protein